MNHKHKVEDTRKRSVLKVLTGNGMEVIFDTIIFGIVFVFLGMELPEAVGIGLGLSIMVEILCAITNYFNDRAWNRIQWGRKVEDVDNWTPLTEEELEAIDLEMALWDKASDEAWAEINDEENNL